MSEINIEKSIIINGDSSIEIQNVDISTGDLIVEFSNGQTFNAGYVKGENGTGYQDAYLQNDDLILELTDGSVNNLGNVKGEKGVGIQNINIIDDQLSFTMDNGQTTPPFQIQKNTTEVALNPGDAIITARNLVTETRGWLEINNKSEVTMHSVDQNGAANEISEVLVVFISAGNSGGFNADVTIKYLDNSQNIVTQELFNGDNLINDPGTGGSFVINALLPDAVFLPQPYFVFTYTTAYSDESEWVTSSQFGTRYLFEDEQPSLHPFFAEQASNKINFPSPVGPDITKQQHGTFENASFYYWENLDKNVHASMNSIVIGDNIASDATTIFIGTQPAYSEDYIVKHVPELGILITHDQDNNVTYFYTNINTVQDLQDFDIYNNATRTPIQVMPADFLTLIYISKDADGNYYLVSYSELNGGKLKVFDLSNDVSLFYNDINTNTEILVSDLSTLAGTSVVNSKNQSFNALPIFSNNRIYFYSENTGIYYSCTTDLTDLRTEIDFNTEGASNLWADLLFFFNGSTYRKNGQFSFFDGSILLNTTVGLFFLNLENGDTSFTKLGDYNGATSKNSRVSVFNPHTNFIMIQDKQFSNQLTYKATIDNGVTWHDCIQNQNPVEDFFTNSDISARTLYIDKIENSFILKTEGGAIIEQFDTEPAHAVFSYLESGLDSMFSIEPITNLNSQLKTFYKS